MPYNHCQKIMPDGHRCNKQFYVRTNTSTHLRFCPEHDTGKKKGNRKMNDAKIEQKSKFLDKLMKSYDNKIDEYDAKFESVRTVLVRMDIRIKNLEDIVRNQYVDIMAGEEE